MMITKSHVKILAKRQVEINKMQAAFNDEFNKYHGWLLEKARAVLKWKDDNLGHKFLNKYQCRGYIKELRRNCLVLCIPDKDPELPAVYYNVPYDEIFSEDWKKSALKKYREEMALAAKNAEQARIEEGKLIEERERAEYERLKAKFEGEVCTR